MSTKKKCRYRSLKAIRRTPAAAAAIARRARRRSTRSMIRNAFCIPCGEPASAEKENGNASAGMKFSMTSLPRIRLALQEGRKNEIMYHVGRPGHELIYNQRVLHSWGIDGHNSHTNVCSAGARTGYAFWHGFDRPSPDHSNARFILLLSSHLEAGHYFNPHAQRIIDGKMDGAKVCVIDTRLSNTASKADYWLSTWPGSESAVLLAMCNVLLQENLIDREFVRRWVNWEEYLREEHPAKPQTFEAFLEILKQIYARYTPEFAAQESGADARMIVEVAREAGRAGSALSTHVWRNAAAGNLGGWQVARCARISCSAGGRSRYAGWNFSERLEQVHSHPADDAAAAQRMERIDVGTRISPGIFRNEFSVAAFSEGGSRKARALFFPRL